MEPNRYAKNRHIRPDGPWKLLQALVTLLLLCIGILGIAIHLFTQDHIWLHGLQWLQASRLNLVLAVIGAIALFFVHRYISHLADDRRRTVSHLPLYGMLLMGIYFTLHLFMTGHW